MYRNLRALQVATSINDLASFGHIYHWGRAADGYEIPTSGITSFISSSDNPGQSDFIISNDD
jgi:hypothetical protein